MEVVSGVEAAREGAVQRAAAVVMEAVPEGAVAQVEEARWAVAAWDLAVAARVGAALAMAVGLQAADSREVALRVARLGSAAVPLAAWAVRPEAEGSSSRPRSRCPLGSTRFGNTFAPATVDTCHSGSCTSRSSSCTSSHWKPCIAPARSCRACTVAGLPVAARVTAAEVKAKAEARARAAAGRAAAEVTAPAAEVTARAAAPRAQGAAAKATEIPVAVLVAQVAATDSTHRQNLQTR